MRRSALAPARNAWIVLAVVALANFGNFYVYDSIGPIAGMLNDEFGAGARNPGGYRPMMVFFLASGALGF